MIPTLRSAITVSCVSVCKHSFLHQNVRTAAPSLLRFAPSASPAVSSVLNRCYSHLRISRNMEFFSADEGGVKRNPGTLTVSSPSSSRGRPLTILMCWLMSKDSHVKKFANFYTDLGFDVLKIRLSPFDLIRPTKGSQVLAGQMLDFLHQNPQHSTVLVHGFSVGAYQFCESLVQIEQNFERHGPLVDRFVGQIWDSAVDIHGIPDGTARAVTNNKLLQFSIRRYLMWYLKVNYSSATVHYEASSAKMHEGYLNTPGLFLFSKSDVVSTPEMNAPVIENWEKKGLEVYVKCFEKSRHVSHFYKYKKEYIEEVMAFLQVTGLLEGDRKRAAGNH